MAIFIIIQPVQKEMSEVNTRCPTQFDIFLFISSDQHFTTQNQFWKSKK